MKTELLKVSIRHGAIFIPENSITGNEKQVNATTTALVANAVKMGFTFSEQLLHALNNINPKFKLELLDVLKEVTGVNKNWTPLVKEWDIPTGETVFDHIVTLFANIFQTKKATKLSCGHIIPDGTFPLERYNGCPFCGTPFEFGELKLKGQGSKLKVLELWNDKAIVDFYRDLLQSKTALYATQAESLKTLLSFYSLPQDVEVGMKETLILVIDTLVANERADEAKVLSRPKKS